VAAGAGRDVEHREVQKGQACTHMLLPCRTGFGGWIQLVKYYQDPLHLCQSVPGRLNAAQFSELALCMLPRTAAHAHINGSREGAHSGGARTCITRCKTSCMAERCVRKAHRRTVPNILACGTQLSQQSTKPRKPGTVGKLSLRAFIIAVAAPRFADCTRRTKRAKQPVGQP